MRVLHLPPWHAHVARAASALTTLLRAVEPEVQRLLAIPADVASAATVALGWPDEPFLRRLARRPPETVAFGERWGEPLRGNRPGAASPGAPLTRRGRGG